MASDLPAATRPDLPGFVAALGTMLADPPTADDRFGALMARAFRAVVPYDHMVVFGYRGEAPPIALAHTFSPSDYRIFVTLYQDGPYRLDPFYRAAREPRPGFWRMRELAPDRFFSSEYFRNYYAQTRLAEEVGFFVTVPDDAAVVVSLMRRAESGPFHWREAALLTAAEPLVRALVRSRWSGLVERFERTTKGMELRPAGTVPAAALWDDIALTAREAEIVEMVLQGHSSEAIAQRLSIATGTVKVHRRNVYRKLGISSQTQLLAAYLERLGRA